MVHQEQITFDTTGHRQMDDLTGQVAAVVGRSGIVTGIVQVSCVGSTAAVGTIEFEPGLEHDLPEMLDRLIPPSREVAVHSVEKEANFSQIKSSCLAEWEG